uniref:Uncharacterized protein n=1 Tax=Arundo donax TaxID=35708 RepID=A0A0A8ZV48_ARUDO
MPNSGSVSRSSTMHESFTLMGIARTTWCRSTWHSSRATSRS